MSDAFQPATWEFASSMLAVGLSYRDALACVAVGFFIVSIPIALTGAMGVLYHIPFPVLARASWGFYGSYVPIVSRAVLAIFWFAVQSMNGANATRVMIGAIWPSFLRLHNSIPENQGITINQMVSFFIFWVLQFPFLCMHPNTLRWMFLAKSIIVPITFLAMLIWAWVSTDGTGGNIWGQKTSVHGSEYSWAWLASLTSVIGNYATLSVNQADFSRYSKVSHVTLEPGAVFTFIAFIGISASSAGAERYGTLTWDPMALVSFWSSRACRFFVGASFALSVLGVNISANSLSAANDLMALFPSYINIRRGQIICALFCWALVPWKILESAGSFLSFMSAYAVFLGPIAAILAADYWIVRGRKYDVLALYHQHGDLYSFEPTGCNWRALAAFLIGVAPSLPGLVASVNGSIDVGVGIHPYQFGWLLGFVASGLIYWGLSWGFPEKGLVNRDLRPDEVYDGGGGPMEGEEVLEVLPDPGKDLKV
ncbi:MAG: hypothetical protein Q9162_006195 [Coniocarpon cinnabarinum]